jgi:hypothetical protein
MDLPSAAVLCNRQHERPLPRVSPDTVPATIRRLVEKLGGLQNIGADGASSADDSDEAGAALRSQPEVSNVRDSPNVLMSPMPSIQSLCATVCTLVPSVSCLEAACSNVAGTEAAPVPAAHTSIAPSLWMLLYHVRYVAIDTTA